MSDTELAERVVRSMELWVLDADRRVVRGSLAEWMAMKMAFDDRCRVGSDHIGRVWISTVFLGLDMNHSRVIRPELPTLCFETLIGRPDGSQIFDRYSTWEEAEEGHAKAVAECKEQLG